MGKSILNLVLLVIVTVMTVMMSDVVHGGSPGPVVQVSTGMIMSSMEKSRLGRDYFSWKGIPYAAPPVGELRFAPPQRPAPWSGVRNTTEFGPACAQFDLGMQSVIGEEDCLYLNVFKPLDPTMKFLPVMVFFHSGAFMFASSTNYEPTYFMDEDVILVTVNYRVGVLGFLNAGNVREAQGNQGLKDQVLALKWVQENILSFGGDPKRVTIFGDMAGGASTHYHMYSPMSRGLFSAAISQGGTSLCTWSYIRNPVQAVQKLGDILNCPQGSISRLVSSLKRLDYKTLVGTIPMFFEWSVNPINPFGPSVETINFGEERFLTETPYQTVQKGPVNNVPWMMGVNDELGLVAAASIVANAMQREDINKNWRRIAPLIFYYRETAYDQDLVSDAIRQHFFQNRPIDFSTLKTFVDLYSDRLFVQGDRKAILSHLKNSPGDQPVYLYIMSHHSNNSFVRIVPDFNVTNTGATEGDELQYLFNSPNFFYQQEIAPDHKDFMFSHNMVKLWAHFATYRTTDSMWSGQTPRTVNWQPVNRQRALSGQPLEFLNINDELSIVSEPFKTSLDFWDRLPLNEFENEVV